LEVCFRDVKQLLGFEDPQNRVSAATQRTAPFIFYIYDLVLLWFAQSGHRLHKQPLLQRSWYTHNWSDFPIVVVSWWLEAVVGLVDGRKRNADVSFMDGPYMVHVFAKHRELWQAECVERRAAGTNVIHQFDFTPDPFIRSLIPCSDDLLQECSAKGWESTDVDSVILQRERLIHYVAKNRCPR
jgi:hypothetical protein